MTILAFVAVLAFTSAAPSHPWNPTTLPLPPTPKSWTSPIPPSPTPSTSALAWKPQKHPLPSRPAELRKKLFAVRGCNPNICFAIDGSESINETEFNNEKNFVLDFEAVINADGPVALAAVQYATGNMAITPLTFDSKKFNLKVNAARQMGGASFLADGINYCFHQLRTRRGEANKIVILVDGKSNLGANAVNLANLFRKSGGEVIVVAARFPDYDKLLGLAGNKTENILEVTSFLDVSALWVLVGDLVVGVCDANLH